MYVSLFLFIDKHKKMYILVCIYIENVMDITRIQKWGNSLAVRLPKDIAKRLQLKEGSTVLVTQEDASVRIKETKGAARRGTEWRAFLIPSKKKKRENVSGVVDSIMYGKRRR